MILRIVQFVRHEAFFWIVGLLFLALIVPGDNSHVTICPFNNFGIDWCPGCGLGRSVSFALHGDLPASLHTHPFGLFALIMIVSRIFTLLASEYRHRIPRYSLFIERNMHG